MKGFSKTLYVHHFCSTDNCASMSGGESLHLPRKHLLICISFLMEMQNLFFFPPYTFSFGPVYYSTVTILNLSSNGGKKKNHISGRWATWQPSFYLHSVIKVICHELLLIINQIREQICLKSNPVKKTCFGFPAKSDHMNHMAAQTVSGASTRGRQEQSWVQEQGLVHSICPQPGLISQEPAHEVGAASRLPHLFILKQRCGDTSRFVVLSSLLGAFPRGKYIKKKKKNVGDEH